VTAILLLGPGGRAIADRLLQALPDATLHGFAHSVPEAAIRFSDVGAHVRGLFRRRRGDRGPVCRRDPDPRAGAAARRQA